MGKLYYLYLNRNDDLRNVNVNRTNLDNYWNENCRFLLVR